MNIKHTPGPWMAHEKPASQYHYGATIGDGPTSVIATCDPSNARLIAAAPELLNICESILAEVDYEGLQLESSRVAKLRAAIAKATGTNI